MISRSHLCGEVSAVDIGQEVSLCGWVRRRRDHGGLIFVDLTDRSGFAQVVFTPDLNEAFNEAEKLRSEFVIGVRGVMRGRPEGTINKDIPTGEVELEVKELEVFAAAETPPFLVQDDTDAKEELRLRYRFLDLRRPRMQEILRLRHKLNRATRNFLDSERFCEVETPILSKTTPEGARDFLVPSRLSRGEFYALPQSPQLYKQVLMCGGFDRYYQIARCFRDEDLRANRQPEFSQIDIEASFVNESHIKVLVEGLLRSIWKDCLDIELGDEFPVITYDEAMNRFGLDAPDMRFGMELVDLSSLFAKSEFKVFREAVNAGGVVKAINLKGGVSKSRKELDDLVSFVGIYEAKGLAWIKFESEGPKSPIAKFISDSQMDELRDLCGVEVGDCVLFVADKKRVANSALGALRVHLAEKEGLIDSSERAFV